MKKYRKFKAFFPFIIPVFFFGTCTYLYAFYHESLTVDGYFIIQSSKILLRKWEHTGYAAGLWPPLYTVLVSVLGLLLGVETAARYLSILSGTGFLASLPYISKNLKMGMLPGILVQSVIGFSPSYLNTSLQVETHMMDAFFMSLAILFGIKYFSNKKLNTSPMIIPKKLLLFATLACLTRYSSLILVPAIFLTVVLIQNTFRSWMHGLRLSGTVLISVFAWLIYNYGTNGYFFSPEKGGSSLTSFGMAEMGLLETRFYKWVLSGQLKSEGLMDFLLTHPYQFLNHMINNFIKIVNLHFLGFPPLGYLSFFIGVGLIWTLVNYKRPDILFLMLFGLLYILLIVPLRYNWIYFLHYGGILSVIGTGGVRNALKNSWQAEGSQLFRILVLLVVIPIVIFQFQNHKNNLIVTMRNEFRRSWLPTKYVEEAVKNLNSSLRGSSNRVKLMTHFGYVPNLFKYGFTITSMPLPVPGRNPSEFFCYTDLTEAQIDFYEELNYPQRLGRRGYVPPDYFLMTPVFDEMIPPEGYDFSPYSDYLQLIGWSRNIPFVRLYKVDTDRLNCSV